MIVDIFKIFQVHIAACPKLLLSLMRPTTSICQHRIGAENESPYRIANEQEWMTHNTHIEIILVSDNHKGLYKNAEYYDEYLSLIENRSAQK